MQLYTTHSKHRLLKMYNLVHSKNKFKTQDSNSNFIFIRWDAPQLKQIKFEFESRFLNLFLEWMRLYIFLQSMFLMCSAEQLLFLFSCRERERKSQKIYFFSLHIIFLCKKFFLFHYWMVGLVSCWWLFSLAFPKFFFWLEIYFNHKSGVCFSLSWFQPV